MVHSFRCAASGILTVDHLGDSLVAFLGSDLSSSRLRELVQLIGEQPAKVDTAYNFAHSGIALLTERNALIMVMFHLNTRAVQSGWFQGFQRTLPYGLHHLDDRSAVIAKLERLGQPRPTGAVHEGAAADKQPDAVCYLVRDVTVMVEFNKPNSPISSVSVFIPETGAATEVSEEKLDSRSRRVRRRPGFRRHQGEID
jgi:hypothetical protein